MQVWFTDPSLKKLNSHLIQLLYIWERCQFWRESNPWPCARRSDTRITELQGDWWRARPVAGFLCSHVISIRHKTSLTGFGKRGKSANCNPQFAWIWHLIGYKWRHLYFDWLMNLWHNIVVFYFFRKYTKAKSCIKRVLGKYCKKTERIQNILNIFQDPFNPYCSGSVDTKTHG